MNNLDTKLADYKISKLTKEIEQDQNLPANIRNKSKKKYNYNLDSHFYVKKSFKKPIKIANEKSNISQLKELRKLTELGLFKLSFKDNYVLFKPTKLNKYVNKVLLAESRKVNKKIFIDLNLIILFSCIVVDVMTMFSLPLSNFILTTIIANISVFIIVNSCIISTFIKDGCELTAHTYLKAIRKHISHHKYSVLKQKLGK